MTAHRRSAAPPLLTFAQAEQIGQDLHDHWEKMAGAAPMGRDDLGWADLVQRVVRLARDVAGGGNG
jgi:hypothetical protein